MSVPLTAIPDFITREAMAWVSRIMESQEVTGMQIGQTHRGVWWADVMTTTGLRRKKLGQNGRVA